MVTRCRPPARYTPAHGYRPDPQMHPAPAVASTPTAPLAGPIDWTYWEQHDPSSRAMRPLLRVGAVCRRTQAVVFVLELSKWHQTQEDAERICRALGRVYRS